MELVDFSLIFRGIGGRGIGGLFVDFSWNWWIFRGIGGFFGGGVGGGTGKGAPRMLQGCSRDAPRMLRGC